MSPFKEKSFFFVFIFCLSSFWNLCGWKQNFVNCHCLVFTSSAIVVVVDIVVGLGCVWSVWVSIFISFKFISFDVVDDVVLVDVVVLDIVLDVVVLLDVVVSDVGAMVELDLKYLIAEESSLGKKSWRIVVAFEATK